MSAQGLGPKRLRQIAMAVGEPIRRGWSHGGYDLGFVTFEHIHGAYNVKTGEWEFDEPAEVMHYYPMCDWLRAGTAWPGACGETAELAVTLPGDAPEPERQRHYDVVCDLEPGHPKRHQCGSLSWARDGEGGV